MSPSRAMPEINRFSFREQERRFRAACEWLIELGVAMDNTRVAAYSQHLTDIANYHESGNIEKLVKQRGFHLLMNAMMEASEFVDIYAGLKDITDPRVASRLSEFVCGAEILSDETRRRNRSRNIGFELTLAAAASSCGLPISLTPPADVSIPLMPNPFVIECKRPFVRRKISNQIRRGLHQLVKRYDASEDPDQVRGILALSISKTENDGSRVLRAKNKSDLRAQVYGIFDKFLARYETYWRGHDPRTLAVFLELRAPCLLNDPSLIVVVRHFTVAVICHPRDRPTLDTIAIPFKSLTSAPFV